VSAAWPWNMAGARLRSASSSLRSAGATPSRRSSYLWSPPSTARSTRGYGSCPPRRL
jgi:hypothetical protein